MRKIALPLLIVGLFALCQMTEPFLSGAFAQEEKHGKKKDEDITGGRFAGDPIYVHITPMVLPIIDSNGVEQIVSLILSVHVKDLDAANALHRDMPKAIDALYRALYGGLGDGTLRNGKFANVTRIKSKAMAAIGEVIGPENVSDVLIEGVSQRML